MGFLRRLIKLMAFLILVLLAGLTITACGGGGGGESTPPSDNNTGYSGIESPGTYTATSTLVKNSNVKAVSASEVESQDEMANTITLSSTASTYSVGDLLFGDENTRIAKKVTAVNQVGGKTVLTVADPAFDELFSEGSISYSITPDWSQGQVTSRALLQKPFEEYFTRSKIQSRYLDEGNVSDDGGLNLDNTSLFNIYTKYENGSYKIDWARSSIMGQGISDESDISDAVTREQFDTAGQIKATITEGLIKIVPTITGDLGPTSAWAQMDMLMIFDLVIEIESTGNVVFNFTKNLMPPITVMIPIAGVWVDVSFDIPASFIMDASITGKATFEYRREQFLHVEMEYSVWSGFGRDWWTDPPLEEKQVTLEAMGTIDAKLSLQPRVTVKLISLLGPFIVIEPYVRGVLALEYIPSTGSYDWIANQDDLYLGLSGFAGLDIPLANDLRTPDLFNIYLSWDLLRPGDPVNLLTWYFDSDGDGYGNPSITTLASAKPSDFVSNSTDCNDTNNSIHPGAAEIPNDGIDQDCNGSDATVGGVYGKLHEDTTSGPVLAGAIVTCGGQTATTLADGTYSLTNVAAGLQTLTFSKTGYQPYSRVITVTTGRNYNAGDNYLLKDASSAPRIRSITPNIAHKGTNVTFTLNGTGFQNGFTAKLINELGIQYDASSVQFVNSISVKVTVFLGVGPTSTQQIKIINPDDQSDQISFTAQESSPAPTLSVSPVSGSQGTIFYYSGSGYTSSSTVEWHVQKPDGTEYAPAELSGKVDSSGNFSHSYLSHCGNVVGTYEIWAIDKSTGKSSTMVTESITASESCVSVQYEGHFAYTDWMEYWAQDGQIAGTADGNQMEAIKIQTTDYGITYRAHVAFDDWQGWVSNGSIAGTVGQAKSLQAIEINLVGAPTNLHVSYRVYVEGQGWQEWVSDGTTAGTTGLGLAIQAIEIKIQDW